MELSRSTCLPSFLASKDSSVVCRRSPASVRMPQGGMAAGRRPSASSSSPRSGCLTPMLKALARLPEQQPGHQPAWHGIPAPAKREKIGDALPGRRAHPPCRACRRQAGRASPCCPARSSACCGSASSAASASLSASSSSPIDAGTSRTPRIEPPDGKQEKSGGDDAERGGSQRRGSAWRAFVWSTGPARAAVSGQAVSPKQRQARVRTQPRAAIALRASLSDTSASSARTRQICGCRDHGCRRKVNSPPPPNRRGRIGLSAGPSIEVRARIWNHSTGSRKSVAVVLGLERALLLSRRCRWPARAQSVSFTPSLARCRRATFSSRCLGST